MAQPLQLYTIPNWFFGYDIALEILFGLVTLLVAIYAFKLYRISRQRELRLFSTSFILMSVSYFTWSLLNLYLVEELTEQTKVLYLPSGITVFSVLAIYAHILLFMSGLVTLFYMSTGIRSKRAYIFMLTITLLTLLFSFNKSLAIYTTSSLILAFVIIHFGLEYLKTGNKKTGLNFIAFILLMLANINLMLAKDNYMNYVISHILELGAFSIILASVVLIVKHGQKKKSA